MKEKTNPTKLDVNSPEWVLDFESKNQRLGQIYKATPAKEIYRTIFGDLTKELPLFLRDIKKTVVAKDYDDILKYIEEYDTVFVYLQEFMNSYSRAHDSIESLYGFIVDIDGVRSRNLNEIMELIDHAPLKPNLIVSSGNGVHLYYLFEHPFQFYGYTYVTAIASFHANIELSRKGAFNIIKKVHKGVCNWYKKKNQDYVVDVLHLSQPLRMCGAKTKNPELRTEGFVITEHRMDLEDIAELVGVELVDEEIVPFIKARDPQFVEEHAAYLKEMAMAEEREEADKKFRAEKSKTFVRDYAKNRHLCTEKAKAFIIKEAESRLEYPDAEEVQDSDAAPIRNKPKKKGKTCFDLYEETFRRIRAGGKDGKRHNLLHVLCSRAAMHHIPVEVMNDTVRQMADYFTTLNPDEPITEDDIASAKTGYEKRWKYTNSHILSEWNIDLEMENKEIVRRETNKVNKAKRDEMIFEIAEFVFQENPKTSLRGLFKILAEDYNVDIKRSSVVGNPKIKEIKAKYQPS